MGDCAYRRRVSRDRRGTSLRPLDLLARGVRQVWRVGSRTGVVQVQAEMAYLARRSMFADVWGRRGALLE
jgi:hypothetical protein